VIPKPFDPVTISEKIQLTWNASFSRDKQNNMENSL